MPWRIVGDQNVRVLCTKGEKKRIIARTAGRPGQGETFATDNWPTAVGEPMTISVLFYDISVMGKRVKPFIITRLARKAISSTSQNIIKNIFHC